MYKQPSYFEEEKISLRGNKIALFCIAIAIATIAIVVVTGVLAYRLIKHDFGTESEPIAGSKTVGKMNSPTGEVVKEQIPEVTSPSPQPMAQSMIFPKHDFSVAMESQLPQYSDEIAKKVVNVYFEETKKVYLTFDDGPSRVTDDILDILDRYNVKATFFVLGSNVDANPELVKRAYDSGHFIASHGYTHKYSSIYVSSQTVLDEYNYTEGCIKEALENPDYHSRVFRFPGGSVGGYYKNIKKEAKEYLKQNGIVSLDWNSLSKDAEGAHTKEMLLQNVINTVGNKQSVVILMHDSADKILTYETLPSVIQYLRENGYSFKNLYDIL